MNEVKRKEKTKETEPAVRLVSFFISIVINPLEIESEKDNIGPVEASESSNYRLQGLWKDKQEMQTKI